MCVVRQNAILTKIVRFCERNFGIFCRKRSKFHYCQQKPTCESDTATCPRPQVFFPAPTEPNYDFYGQFSKMCHIRKYAHFTDFRSKKYHFKHTLGGGRRFVPSVFAPYWVHYFVKIRGIISLSESRRGP